VLAPYPDTGALKLGVAVSDLFSSFMQDEAGKIVAI
jgi:hypothetical protein